MKKLRRVPPFSPSLSRVAQSSLKRVLVSAAVGAAVTAFAANRPPIEDFARRPETAQPRLSPDGKYFAFVRDYTGRQMLFIDEIDGKRIWRLDPGEAHLANDAPKEVEKFVWASDRRLVISTTVWDSRYGTVAVDMDAQHRVAISGYEDDQVRVGTETSVADEVIYRAFDAVPTVYMLERHRFWGGNEMHPDVLRVDTSTGLSSVIAKNPGEVTGWGIDKNGVVRVGFTRHGELSGAMYRERNDAPWQPLLPLERRPNLYPVGYDGSLNRAYVATLTSAKRWSVFPLDLATKSLGEPMYADNEYDLYIHGLAPSLGGVPLVRPFYDPRTGSLVGITYVAEAPRVKWFDKKFGDYQRGIDRALPNTVNLPLEMSRDGKRMLWFAFSDQDPGSFHLFDFEKKTLTRIASRMSWITPAHMAAMLAIKYPARDGTVIHGYLTVPSGHPPKGLPLIVLPHGGPFVRDAWGFDPWVQLLASRGYAVLQMNYRGSVGYGEEFFQKGFRQIGGEIQDDIEDATRWAIASGVADPKRIAIVGGSYGGYSALFGLGKNPELYRCGISYAGVTDWTDIFDEHKNDPDYKIANAHWREQIADPVKDAERLKQVSPVNFADRITAPVLIIQGNDDRIVPRRQARLMIEALEKAGQKPESLFVAHQGHNFANEKGTIEIFKAMVGFLEKNLGPGVE